MRTFALSSQSVQGNGAGIWGIETALLRGRGAGWHMPHAAHIGAYIRYPCTHDRNSHRFLGDLCAHLDTQAAMTLCHSHVCRPGRQPCAQGGVATACGRRTRFCECVCKSTNYLVSEVCCVLCKFCKPSAHLASNLSPLLACTLRKNNIAYAACSYAFKMRTEILH